MFGYVTVDKAELKIREYETYRGFYCGLCQSLKKEYGIRGQITLTYDLTFVALLLSSLYEPESEIYRGRCIVHPAAKHMMIENEYTRYAAHMGMLLSWYKFRDDWADERRVSGIVGVRAYHYALKKAGSLYPGKARVISEALRELDRLEKEQSRDIDRVAGTTGRFLGEILAMKEDCWRETLYRTGFFLGKYIYLMDAYDDMEKDAASGSYNILLLRKRENYGEGKEEEARFEADCGRLLMMMVADCTAEMEKLPCVQDIAIIRNVLYDGIWNRYRKLQKDKEEPQRGKKKGPFTQRGRQPAQTERN